MATHSSILAWRSPWMEEPGRLVHGVVKSQTQLSYSPRGHKELDKTERLHFHFFFRFFLGMHSQAPWRRGLLRIGPFGLLRS